MISGQSLAAVETGTGTLGALIERTAAGDETALAALYDATAPLVNGLALRIVVERAAAEEVTADVYMQVWRKAERYDSLRGGPLRWLLMLIRGRAIDRLRGAAMRPLGAERLEDTMPLISSAPGPEETHAASERSHLVRRALSLLAGEQREAIELAYFGGLSHSEIASALGQPLGTVKTRIRLGMQRLRETLAYAGRAAR